MTVKFTATPTAILIGHEALKNAGGDLMDALRAQPCLRAEAILAYIDRELSCPRARDAGGALELIHLAALVVAEADAAPQEAA